MSDYYYLAGDSQKKGPFSLDALRAEPIERSTLCWCKGLPEWTPAEQIPELRELVAELPPTPPVQNRPRRLPGSDFILCNPALPRMAQWITAYALVVVPLLWVGGFFVKDSYPAKSPIYGLMNGLSAILAMIGLAYTVLMIIGSLKLRAGKASGAKWIFWTVTGNWITGGLYLAICFGIGLGSGAVAAATRTDPSTLYGSPASGLFAILYYLTAIACLVFEIVAWIWLARNRRSMQARLTSIPAEPVPA